MANISNQHSFFAVDGKSIMANMSHQHYHLKCSSCSNSKISNNLLPLPTASIDCLVILILLLCFRKRGQGRQLDMLRSEMDHIILRVPIVSLQNIMCSDLSRLFQSTQNVLKDGRLGHGPHIFL